jgi:Putative auto-transporter adhesin, head GIN domain
MNDMRNRASLIVGVLLILAGALFFLGRQLGFSNFGSLWPLLLVFLGGAFFVGMFLGGKQTAGLAIPATIITMIGLILLVQNWFNIYETWAYAWTLIVTAVGIGIAIAGSYGDNAEMRRSGWGLARLGLLLFVVFGAFFEFIFHFSGVSERGSQFFWPVLLMLVGIVLLISRIYRLLSTRGEQLSWEQRDLFWPVIITGFGLLWFLINQGWLPFENLSAILGLWPVLLVAIGLDLIAGRRYPWLGALLAAALVGGGVWLSFNAGRLNLNTQFNMDLGSVAGSTERVTGSGNIITESRDLSEYDSIQLSAGGAAEVLQGDQEGLTVEVDDNLLQYLDIQVHGRVLEIGVKPGYSLAPSQPIHYLIRVKSLRQISVSGTSQVNMESLSGDQLSVESSGLGKFLLHNLALKRLDIGISGSASVELDGSADLLNLQVSGAGTLDGPELETGIAKVEISGTGNAVLRVSESLNVEVSGAGSVSYYGNPVVTKDVSGAGIVKQLGSQ